jgi:hypothetical protein
MNLLASQINERCPKEEFSTATMKSKGDVTGSRHVSFSDVKVREFGVTFFANHPKTTSPALSLDWCFTELPPEPVGEYERRRPRRRKKDELMLDVSERIRRLVEDFGFTQEELNTASRYSLMRRCTSVTASMPAKSTSIKSEPKFIDRATDSSAPSSKMLQQLSNEIFIHMPTDIVIKNHQKVKF